MFSLLIREGPTISDVYYHKSTRCGGGVAPAIVSFTFSTFSSLDSPTCPLRTFQEGEAVRAHASRPAPPRAGPKENRVVRLTPHLLN